jgi:hypothetical protein
MKKKTIILIAVIVAVVIGVLVYMHYTPVWVSISNVICGAAGVVVGWIAHVLYNKYIKE